MEVFNFGLFLSKNCRFIEAMWVSALGRCDPGMREVVHTIFFRFARGLENISFIHKLRTILEFCCRSLRLDINLAEIERNLYLCLQHCCNYRKSLKCTAPSFT